MGVSDLLLDPERGGVDVGHFPLVVDVGISAVAHADERKGE